MLGVLTFLALVTCLLVVDPREGTTLVTDLLSESPPAPATYLLLVAWDVCYRIGTGWWASVGESSGGPTWRRSASRSSS